MSKYLLLKLVIVLFLFTGCNNTDQPEAIVQRIETAHQKDLFLQKHSVSYDLNLTFGGQERLNARVTMRTNSSQIRIDRSDGISLVYDGEKVYQTPDTATYPGARFDIFTWPYFFAIPYKLSDPGTRWLKSEFSSLNDQPYEVFRLEFDQNIGDAPDDWYVVYANPESHLLEVAAYIVTFGQSQDKAEEDPHAIKYENFKMIDGVSIARKWTFWGWDGQKGLTEKLGEATINNLNFFHPDPTIYQKPQNAKVVEMTN